MVKYSPINFDALKTKNYSGVSGAIGKIKNFRHVMYALRSVSKRRAFQA